MTVSSRDIPLASGRFMVLQTLEAPSVWGAVYLVAGAFPEAVPRVLREVRVPNLRSGLDERLTQARQALGEWRDHPHPSRARVLDVAEERDRLWIVTDRARGRSIQDFVERAGTPTGLLWRAATAASLAQAMHALLSLPTCRHLVPRLSSRHVFVTSEGSVTLVLPGVACYLRPQGMVDLTAEEIEQAAIIRFGELLCTLFAGEEFRRGDVLLEGALPEGLGDLVLRAVTSRQDRYLGFESLRADFTTFDQIVRAEAPGRLSWDELDLRGLEPVPWHRRWLPPAACRTLDRWASFARARPTVVWGICVTLLATMLMVVLLEIVHSRPLNLARFDGPALFVTESDGTVEVVDASSKMSAGWIDLGRPITAVAFSPHARRVIFSVPATSTVATLDLGDHHLVQTHMTPPPRQLRVLPGQTMALGMSADPILHTFDMAHLTAGRDIRLPQVPRDVAVVSRVNGIAYLSSDGASVVLYAPKTQRFLGTEGLTPPARSLRLDPRHNEVWVLPEHGNEIPVFDAATLEPTHTVVLPSPPVDVAFLEEPYVLLEGSGDVAVVLRPSYTVEAAPLRGVPGARRIVSPVPGELWFMSGGLELEVHALDGTGPPRRVQLRAIPLDLTAGGAPVTPDVR